MAIKTRPPKDRFWNKVTVTKGCWPWRGATNGRYGIIGKGGRGVSPIYAHRLSYEMHFGSIPNGMQVMHSCDNPICVNPGHLFVGTQTDNMRDCTAKKRHVSGYGMWASKNRNTRAKLTDEQVIELRNLRNEGW